MKKEDIINRKGFIAALDQSSGSSAKTLSKYGIDKDGYNTEEKMLDLMHEMRKRIITNKYFSKEKIIGVIIFEEEMERIINEEYTAEYLLNQKEMLSFVKIDKGLDEIKDGVQLMKDIPNLKEDLDKARKHGIYGTKMRSVIHENNKEGIKKIVNQQFELAKIIWKNGLVPIIEPEVNIYSKQKSECERTLKKYLDKYLSLLDDDIRIILKLSLPEKENLYEEYTAHKNILKVIALSGGYDRSIACEKLSKNKGVIASFSKALIQDLRKTDSDELFTIKLKYAIDEIYEASVK